MTEMECQSCDHTVALLRYLKYLKYNCVKRRFLNETHAKSPYSWLKMFRECSYQPPYKLV